MTTPKLQTYAALIVLNDNRLFALRRVAKHNVGRWEFPAGKGEPGESPDETAVREFFEETGSCADSSDLKEVAITTLPDRNGNPIIWKNYYYVIDASALDRLPDIQEPETHDACLWIPLAHLKILPTADMTGMILPVLEHYLAGAYMQKSQ